MEIFRKASVLHDGNVQKREFQHMPEPKFVKEKVFGPWKFFIHLKHFL